MTGFIDEDREAYGIEPIRKVLPIAHPPTKRRAANRYFRLSKRDKQDLASSIRRPPA
ncbi:hypothetical protein [Sphingomonas bacterium]|uniref:hypothetical protein n=1 Tax=Sphingomonas bacterium TaxID=1895847 RepID=UPI0015755963